MKIGRAALVALGLSFASIVGCTATSASEEIGESSESALRGLAANEIVGTIAYGQTVGPIDYTENPRYRALRFTGTAGDHIRVTVQSDAIAAAWLLGADFTTLTSGRASGLGQDYVIDRTLSSSGTFYVAFREADQEDATFHVSLARVEAPVTPPQPPSGTDRDFVDPCQPGDLGGGQPLSSYFPPGGSSAGKVGSFTISGRYRQCTSATGCAAWTRDDSILRATTGNMTVTGGDVELYLDAATQTDPFRLMIQPVANGAPQSLNWTCTIPNGVCGVGNGYLQIVAAGASNFVIDQPEDHGPRFDDYTQGMGSRCFFEVWKGKNTLSAQGWIEAEVALHGTLRAP